MILCVVLVLGTQPNVNTDREILYNFMSLSKVAKILAFFSLQAKLVAWRPFKHVWVLVKTALRSVWMSFVSNASKVALLLFVVWKEVERKSMLSLVK